MKEIKIETPKGYEIDKENSTFEHIVFKEVKKQLTYEDIAKKLFLNDKIVFYINPNGKVKQIFGSTATDIDPNNAVSKEQLESILALNKLCNVAKYLNDDWLPCFISGGNSKHSIEVGGDGKLRTCKSDGGTAVLKSLVYFKSNELAQQAIEILGEKEIKKALTLNY